MQIPVRFRKSRKAAGIPRINWAHPLTNDLIKFCLPELMLDLVSGELGTITGSPGKTAIPSGGSIDITGRSNYMAWPSVSVSSNFTMSAEALSLNNSAAEPLAFNCSPPNDQLFLVLDTSANLQGGFFGNDSNYYDTEAAGWNVNTVNQGAVTAIDSSAVNVYANGALISTIATTTQPKATTNLQFMIGFSNNSGQTGQARVGYGALWTRALTAGEIAALHSDPYQFLLYPEDDIFAELVGHGAVKGSVQLPLTGVG